MSHSMALHDNAHCQAFYHWIQDSLIVADDPSKGFLPEDLLSNYLESNELKNLKNLVAAIIDREEVRLTPKQIVGNHSKVFSILLRIGQIRFFPRFVEDDDLNDTKLPFKPRNRPSTFPIDPSNPDFFEKFCAEQWKFCPPHLKLDYNRAFDENCILPFCAKELIAKGATAEIYKVKLYHGCNGLHELPTFEPKNHKGKHTEPTFTALKTYKRKIAEKVWEAEVGAFQVLNNRSPNVIGFHSAFRHGDTYNVLLEYADGGSLESYMQYTEPPVEVKDILRIWKRFLELLRGVKDLNQGDFRIWHQDIKPANILVLGSPITAHAKYDCEFKLADLGNSHSKPSSDDDDTDQDTQGTRTYGAPESYRPDSSFGRGSIRVLSTVDIWSIGCVFSEFATWITGGWDEVKNYRQARQTAIRDIVDFQDSDCFHDGTKVLPIVLDWHHQVRSRPQRDCTARVLSMVDEMLQESKHRGNAQTFCTKAHSIYSSAFEDVLRLLPNLDDEDDLIPASRLMHRKRTDPSVLPDDIFPPNHKQFQNFRDQSVSILPTPVTRSYDNIYNTPASQLIGSTPNNATSTPWTSSESCRVTRMDTCESPLAPYGTSSRAVMSNQIFPPAPRRLDRSIVADAETNQHTHTRAPWEIDQHVLTPSESILQVSSAPTKATTPFFAGESEIHARRYSEHQPPGYENNSRINGISSPSSRTILGAISNADSLVGMPLNSIPNHSRPGIMPFETTPQSNTLNGFRQTNPTSPSSLTNVSSQPSTALPLDHSLFPTRNVKTHLKMPPNVPQLSLQDAITWRDQKKESSLASRLSRSEPARLPGDWALKVLDGRDTVFIMDDAESMRPHWPAVTQLFSILAYIIKSHDKDGLDLYFPTTIKPFHAKHSKGLVSTVEKYMNEKNKGPSDISYILERILDDYAERLQLARGHNVPLLNVYVFTDGRWTTSCNVVPAIHNIVRTMVEFSLPEKQVGLQFISFGDDQDGLARLQVLDNRLGLLHDIVDTTPSTGNLYKMLRGAIDRDFDE